MLAYLLNPVLQFMHFLHTAVVFVLTISLYIGRAISLLLVQVCNIIRDILTALAIIGEELYNFLCELNTSIGVVSHYVRTSANGGFNCVFESVVVCFRHIAKFFVNTRLHSKLLATKLGSSIGGFLILLRNALLLIADCAWWVITLLPRWLVYLIIAVGDFIVESITSIRKAFVYTVQVILEDIFRLTIGMVLLFLMWHHRRRMGLLLLRFCSKLKRIVRLCCLRLMLLASRLFRRRVNQTLTTPQRALIPRRRFHLARPSISPSHSDKSLDPQQRCVICRDRQKCVLLLPCKHLCLCEECADYMFISAQRQNCPLCRSDINNSMSVYI